MERETKLDIMEMGRGYLGAILLAILMYTSTASAMYAGENITFETNLTNPVYTVIENQSNLEGLNISYENGNITITTVTNFKPDNFTIILFDNQTHEVIKTISSGGGSGGSTRYVDRNVTVYEPKFYDRNITKEVEVKKVIDKIEYQDTGFEMWHGLLAMVVGGLFVLFMLWRRDV